MEVKMCALVQTPGLVRTKHYEKILLVKSVRCHSRNMVYAALRKTTAVWYSIEGKAHDPFRVNDLEGVLELMKCSKSVLLFAGF